MANIMNIAQIKNNPSREGFDLSQKLNFTAKVGELLPVWWMPVLPTDDIRVSLQSFARTQPLNSSAFARMRGYFNFYFVPYSQMWNKFNPAITQMSTNLTRASGPVLDDNIALTSGLPYITAQQIAEYITALGTSKNQFGFSRALLTCKLLEYLGYGDFYWYVNASVEVSPGVAVADVQRPTGHYLGGRTWSSSPMLQNLKYSPFPLMAYQKIYADYNRYTQWERSNPSTFNLDYIDGSPSSLNLDLTVDGFTDTFNFFDMRYCNWQRDLLHGVIPTAQYGEASVVPVTQSGVDVNADDVVISPAQGLDPGAVLGIDSTGHVSGSPTIVFASGQPGNPVFPSAPGNVSFSLAGITAQNAYTGNISILALRRAEAAQKWKEITLAAEEDYKSQIQAHWATSVSDLLSDMCTYLTGTSLDLSINEVVNQNLTDGNAANIQGKGTMSGNGNVSFNPRGQYGILMCVFHALPILDYTTTAPNFGTLLTDVLQYPIPEFDRIGMEQVPVVRGLNPPRGLVSASSDLFFGYAPQYIDWKTALDRSMGDFRFTLSHWIIGFDDEDLMQADSVDFPDNPNVEPDSVKAGFFKVSPSSVDSIFAVNAGSFVDTDCLLLSNFFKINAVRSLDRNGLPY